jgi:hypothetical protein
MINQLKNSQGKAKYRYRKYLQFLLENANDDIEKFTLSIETWFDAIWSVSRTVIKGTSFFHLCAGFSYGYAF